MSKSDVAIDQLENFIVMPEGVDHFVQWWATVQILMRSRYGIHMNSLSTGGAHSQVEATIAIVCQA